MIKFIALGLIASSFFGANGALAALGSESAPADNSSVSNSKVSSVRYSLSKTTPGNVESVSFTLRPAQARTVVVRLSADDPGQPCENRKGRVTCDLGDGYPAEAITLLDVTAAS